MKPVETKDAPLAIGPYSQGIETEPRELFFFSGQIGVDPATGTLVSGGIEVETAQALQNVRKLLLSQGMDFENVAKVTVFITKMEDFDVMNRVYSTRFTEIPPARSCVAVKALPRSALVEIEVVAVKE